MKKLFFVRHGLTEDNSNHVWSGQRNTKLTEEGMKQAQAVGEELKAKGIQIDLVVSSPLARTRHTAELIAKEIDYPISKIEINPLFIERSFGVLEGMPDHDYYETHSYKDMDKIEQAEQLIDVQMRAERAFKYIGSLDHDNILVVSHGTFGRAFRRVVNNRPHTDEYDRQVVRIPNAELLELI